MPPRMNSSGFAQFLRKALHTSCRTVDPSIDMKMAVREQVNRMSAFTLLAQLYECNPPAAEDAQNLPGSQGSASLGVRISMRAN